MLSVDVSKCIGCEICMLACSANKQGVFSLVSACIRVCSKYSPEGMLSRQVYYCNACGECVLACPTGAIELNNGWLKYDSGLCTSCGECVLACPNGLIHQLPEEGVVLCDGCGDDPACVKWCPKGALARTDSHAACGETDKSLEGL